ncbi:MAG: hypothetical protein U0800_22650 [Isosphaeraceae bacterium]
MAEGRFPVVEVEEQVLDEAIAEDVADPRLDVAHGQAGVVLAGGPVQFQDAAQHRRADELHPLEVQDQGGLPALAEVIIIQPLEYLHGRRVHPQAIPEFGHQMAIDHMHFYRRFERHRRIS